ncbi:MAG: hypothetical protein IAF38_05810 [Bacteroidia bacterium]|nr:hypothetical protein [Bacteroidia bacterium]
MKKKLLIISGLIFFLFALAGFQFYFANNRLGLIIHLKDCDYPWSLHDVSIERRQDFGEWFFNRETYATANFTLAKKDLRKWLSSVDFEVVALEKKGEKNLEFFTDFKDIPEEILRGDTSFSFQVLHSNGERTGFEIEQVDSNLLLVNLHYCVT